MRVWQSLFLFGALAVSARAQSAAVRPEITLGLSFQPDATKDIGRGGYHFTLVPIGPTASGAIHWRLRGESSLGARIEGAFYPLTEMDITTIGTPLDKPGSLGLLTGTIEWRSSDESSFPISVGLGMTRAISAPRSDRQTTPIVALGFYRHLTKRADLRAAFNVATHPIGRSWFQFPVGIAFHPAVLPSIVRRSTESP